MTPEQFRQHGYQVIDWIAQYMEEVEHYPVLSQVAPGEIRGKLPSAPPERGEPFDALLRDVNDIILPGITHWQSPNFFAFFPANHSGPSILGDLLSSGLGVQGMLWATSPACTELETHVLDWLVDMLGLPAQFHSSSAGGGVIQDAASSALLCALLAARERRSQYATNARGVSQRMTAYASSQAHSSIEKAMMVAGLGRENLRMIDVDRSFAMLPDRLEEAIVQDQRAGLNHVAWWPRSEPRRPAAWTRCPPLVRSVVGTGCGCMWMPPCTARPACVRNSAACFKVSNWPTATVSIRTSGCLSTSIAIASMWRTEPP